MNKKRKGILLIVILFLLFTTVFYGQNNGIAYQAVLYRPNVKTLPGVIISTSPMVNTAVCLRFSFLNESNAVEYQETISSQTDQYGIVNTIIGTGTPTGGIVAAIIDIQWGVADVTLVVELDENGSCGSFTEISRQSFSSVPFAFNAITATNVSGVVAVANGGTGANNVDDALINIGAEDFLNKSVDVVLDGDSDEKYPSVKAIKTYVDQEVTTATSDNTITTQKILDGTITTADLSPSASIANANNTTITNDVSTAVAVYPTFVRANTGNLPQHTADTKLSFIPSSGTLSATQFSGDGSLLTRVVAVSAASFSGDLAGDVFGSQGVTVIGDNKVTYTKMQAVGASRLMGNPTAAAAIPSEISVGLGLDLSTAGILTATGANKNLQIAADYTITADDYVILCDTSLGVFTVTLPREQRYLNKILIIKKVDATSNKLLFSPSIYTYPTAPCSSLNYAKTIVLQFDGNYWNQIN